MSAPLTRRALLGTAGAAAAALGVPRPLRAQPRVIKIGVITPVTGAMAEVGQYCRIAAQMVADDVKRSSGKAFDTSGYTYEAIRVIADVLERARSADPRAATTPTPAPR